MSEARRPVAPSAVPLVPEREPAHPLAAEVSSFDLLTEAVDAVFEGGLQPMSGADANRAITLLDAQVRRLQAAQADLLAHIESTGVHHEDGMFSARTMVRHRAKVSGAEAAARTKVARLVRDLPACGEAYRQGLISTCNMRRLARAHGNNRVRHEMIDADTTMMRAAASKPHKEFDDWLTDWVRRVDEDGARDKNQKAHDSRDARIVQEFDKTWTFQAWCAALQGAEIENIFKAFIDAEFTADWERAVAEHGEGNVTVDLLERTDGQRRMDALHRIFTTAASAPPDGAGPQIVLNVLIDQTTHERTLRLLAGDDPGPDDPNRADYRCETVDGVKLDPTETVAATLLSHVRRVVYNAKSVTIDLGHKQRLFTGSAALAARFQSTRCYWPGCYAPSTSCQVDHLRPHQRDGRTDQANGAPMCGGHNRLKENGFTVRRMPDGEFRILRPDGSQLSPMIQ